MCSRSTIKLSKRVAAMHNKFKYFEGELKRGSLLGNEEPHLGGDLPIFKIIYSNLEQRSIFSQKPTHFYVRIEIGVS